MSQEKPDFIGSTPITAHMRIYEQKKGHFFSHRAGTTAYKTNENRFPHIYQKPRLDPLIRRCFCLIVSHPNMTNSRMEKKTNKRTEGILLAAILCSVQTNATHKQSSVSCFISEWILGFHCDSRTVCTHTCMCCIYDRYIYILHLKIVLAHIPWT